MAALAPTTQIDRLLLPSSAYRRVAKRARPERHAQGFGPDLAKPTAWAEPSTLDPSSGYTWRVGGWPPAATGAPMDSVLHSSPTRGP